MNSLTSDAQKHRANARGAGFFYISAAATSIVALKLYEPVLFSPDYLSNAAPNARAIVSGAFCELLLVCSTTGTALMLFPYLRKFNERMALGYFCFRMLETILILVGVVSVLSLLSLSQNAAPPDAARIAAGEALKAIHDWTFMLGPNFMLGINTFLYSAVFYRSRLIPRKIALLGMTGAALIFLASLLEMFGVFPQISVWGAVFAIPVFLYEMTLAGWLIVKGLDNEALASANR